MVFGMMGGMPGMGGMGPMFPNTTMGPGTFGGFNNVQHGMGMSMFGGMGPMGMMLDQMINQKIAAWLRGQNMFPGSFFPTQNYYDQYLAQMQAGAAMGAMRGGFGNDTDRIASILGNMNTMITGKDMDPGLRALFRNMSSGFIQNALPMLSMMAPGTVDSMFGLRGSASLFNMGLAQGMRHGFDDKGVYGGYTLRKDGGDTLGEMGSILWKNLYRTPEDERKMRGIGGAAAGQMFTLMMQQGLVNQDQLPVEEMVNGQKTFNTEKLKKRLQDMAGAVSAMRDIFGDMGKTDAPMAEIFAKLNQLTNGAMLQYSPEKVKDMVRQTHQLAKMTGQGIDAIIATQGGVANVLAASGLNPVMANNIVQRSLEFGAAYNSTYGGYHGWGKSSTDQLMEKDRRTTIAAAGMNSRVANHVGMIMRLGDSGNLKGGKLLDIYNSIRAGDSSMIENWNDVQFLEMAEKAGLTSAQVQGFLMQRSANVGHVGKYGAETLIRESLGRIQVGPQLDQILTGAVATAGGKNVSVGTANTIGVAMRKALMGKELKAEDLFDEGKRTKFLMDKIWGQLTDKQRDEIGGQDGLRAAIEMGYGQMSGAFGNQSVGDIVSLYGERAAEAASKIRKQKVAHAKIADTLGELGVAGPLRRVMEEMGKKGATAEKVAGALFGGSKEAQEFLEKNKDSIATLSKNEKRMKDIADEIIKIENSDMNPEDKKKAIAGLTAEMNDLGDQNKDIWFGKADPKTGKRSGGLREGAEAAGVSAAKMTKEQNKTFKEHVKDREDLTSEIDKIKDFKEKVRKDLLAKKKAAGQKEEVTEEELEEAEKAAAAGADAGGLDQATADLIKSGKFKAGDLAGKLADEQKKIESQTIRITSGTLTLIDNRSGTVAGKGQKPAAGAGTGGGAGGGTA